MVNRWYKQKEVKSRSDRDREVKLSLTQTVTLITSLTWLGDNNNADWINMIMILSVIGCTERNVLNLASLILIE